MSSLPPHLRNGKLRVTTLGSASPSFSDIFTSVPHARSVSPTPGVSQQSFPFSPPPDARLHASTPHARTPHARAPRTRCHSPRTALHIHTARKVAAPACARASRTPLHTHLFLAPRRLCPPLRTRISCFQLRAPGGLAGPDFPCCPASPGAELPHQRPQLIPPELAAAPQARLTGPPLPPHIPGDTGRGVAPRALGHQGAYRTGQLATWAEGTLSISSPSERDVGERGRFSSLGKALTWFPKPVGSSSISCQREGIRRGSQGLWGGKGEMTQRRGGSEGGTDLERGGTGMWEEKAFLLGKPR